MLVYLSIIVSLAAVHLSFINKSVKTEVFH